MESQPRPSAIKSLSILPYTNKEHFLRHCRLSPYQATASPLLFNLFQTIYSKLLHSHSSIPPELAVNKAAPTKATTATAPKLLILLDFDDTLIPSTLIRQKEFRITERNLADTEREALEFYVDAVNEFVDTLLRLVDNNRARSIKIVTNGSASWVRAASFYQSGSLFAELMRPLHMKLVDSKIDIISARDHKDKEPRRFADISLQHIKPYLMKLIFYEYFGQQLSDTHQEIKIVSIGDSPCEFHASAAALKYYLKEQSPEVLERVNVSLHRIKFAMKPNTFRKLGDELKWCTQNMHDIIHNNRASKDYYL